MSPPIAYRFVLLLLSLSALNLPAQDVAITNARIIVGSGPVIPSGTIVVRDGKIASVAAGAANTQGLKVIDAKGMSAMPGFICDLNHRLAAN
jgi:imidazolonepropionase-like amidohydrolase